MLRRNLLIVIGLSTLSFLLGTGTTPISDSDEAFYAQAGREMVEDGDWLTPHYNGDYRFEKPILFYWLTALGYLLVGVTEAAARAPSGLAGVLLALVTYACARRWFDENTGLLAGIITGTSFGYVAVARQALPDLVLAFFITISVWSGLVVFAGPRMPSRSTKRRLWILLCGTGIAAGFLTKGPVGIVLPFIIVGPLAIARCYYDAKSLRVRRWLPFRQLLLDGSLLCIVCLTLSLPWYAAMTAHHGPAYLDRFFMAENFQRFATDRYNAPRPFWYYLPIVFGGLLPWSPLLLLLGPYFRRIIAGSRGLAPVELWLGTWVLAPLAFYSASVGKQPRYILPILPPLAILIARTTSHALHTRSSLGLQRLLTTTSCIAGVVLILFGVLIFRAQILFPAADPTAVHLAATLTGVSGLGLLATAILPLGRLLTASFALASITATLSVHLLVFSNSQATPVEVMADWLNRPTLKALSYGRYQVFVRNLVFYTGRPHVDLVSEQQVKAFLKSEEQVLCIITESAAQRLIESKSEIYELGRLNYLNLGQLTIGTLLWPDPVRDLQTVLLITNRPPPPELLR
ncbi:MAG: hypothetical protein CL484_01490 [Acidobacteria bacterium]|nr:hypothetical protein [Acidobacteriota bacterium]